MGCTSMTGCRSCKKIAAKNGEKDGLVGVLGTNWNQIKLELIAMWVILKAVREETTIAA